MPIAITGTGLFTPPYSISNDELVAAFNAYVEAENAKNADAIARGETKALEPSSAEFIASASGIGRRYAMDRDGILDPAILAPRIPERSNERALDPVRDGARPPRAMRSRRRTPRPIASAR